MTRKKAKVLTPANVTERDPRLDYWNVYGLGGGSHETSTWLEFILGVELSASIPENVREMFDRCRACIAYGCFYYPLFTMGQEELFRLLESTLETRLKEVGFSKTQLDANRGNRRIRLAAKQGLINVDKVESWEAALSLRNAVSHKDRNDTLGPNHAIQSLHVAKEKIEGLYGGAI